MHDSKTATALDQNIIAKIDVSRQTGSLSCIPTRMHFATIPVPMGPSSPGAALQSAAMRGGPMLRGYAHRYESVRERIVPYSPFPRSSSTVHPQARVCTDIFSPTFRTTFRTNESRRCRARNSLILWWVLRDSNPRHSPCKGDALPTELSTRARAA